MNTRNLEFLKDSLKYLGFDEKMHAQLEKNMSEQQPEFRLQAEATFNKEPIEATLHFRRSEQGEMYFFNKYEATLKGADETRSQTFYIQKNSGITFKEAYNLLSGRAVHKELSNAEGQKYQAWLQLDLRQKDQHNNYQVKQFHSNYGYNMEAALAKHPIAELGDPSLKAALLKSMQKGNVQSVTFTKDGKEERMFIEASPQYKSINIYDGHMNRIKQETAKSEEATVKEAPAVYVGELKKDGHDNKKDQAQKEAKELLPKKRVSQRKGIGL